MNITDTRYIVKTTYHFANGDREFFIGEERYVELIDVTILEQAKFHNTAEAALTTAKRYAGIMADDGASVTLKVLSVTPRPFYDVEVITVNK